MSGGLLSLGPTAANFNISVPVISVAGSSESRCISVCRNTGIVFLDFQSFFSLVGGHINT